MKPQILRQAFILSGLFLCSVSDGFIFGQMAGMVVGMETDPDLDLTKDDISWIASTINVTCVCGFGVAGIITEMFGRRRAITILTIPLVANCFIVYYGRDLTVFLLSRVTAGVCYGGVLAIVFISTAEYSAPNIRGLCLNIMTTVGTTSGTAIGHILSNLLHWRTVALLGLIPTVISGLVPCFWVESPSWLAAKGKFDECRDSFRALHGHRGEEAEKELKLLIDLEKFKSKESDSPKSVLHVLKTIKHAVKQRYFWSLAILIAIINVYRVSGGRYQYSILALSMLNDITGTRDILWYTTFVDLFFLAGSMLSCVLISRMKMRTLLFSTAAVGNITLLILSACIYFEPANSPYFSWIKSAFLAFYMISITSGPYPVLEAMFCEIFPFEIKTFCIFLFSIFTGCALVVSIKLFGPMCSHMGYHGVFLLNIALMTLSLTYMWFKLPETKGRTLQEIELFIKTGSYENKQRWLSERQLETGDHNLEMRLLSKQISAARSADTVSEK